MPGSLVIEMEAADGRLWADLALGLADSHQAPGVVQPSGGLARPRSRAGARLKAVFRAITGEAVAGFEWIAAEAVQQVHQQQLLVLLLVLQTQLDQGQGCCRLLGLEPVQPFQQALQAGADPLAPGQEFPNPGPGQQAPLGPGMAGANGVVIGIEQVAPAAVGGLVGGHQGQKFRMLEQELLKKPAGVAQMPFRRTGIGHPLQAEVFRL